MHVWTRGKVQTKLKDKSNGVSALLYAVAEHSLTEETLACQEDQVSNVHNTTNRDLVMGATRYTHDI